MSTFHNKPAQFRSFKRPVSLRLGLAPSRTHAVCDDGAFELDSPGIDFDSHSASLLERMWDVARVSPNGEPNENENTEGEEN